MDPEVDSDTPQSLRAAREARGWSLRQAAERLHITEAQVKGLEEENYAALPGAAFARGFLKNYARLLNMDPEPMLKAYDAHNNGSGLRPTETVLPGNEGPLLDYSRRILTFSILIGIAIIAAVWWFWSNAPARHAPPLKSSPSVTGRSATVKHPVAPVSATNTAPKASAAALALNAEALPPVMTTNSSVAHARGLTFQFSADCWVQVKDASGRTLLAALGRRGNRLRIDSGTPPYRVLVGKASAVTIRYQGNPVALPANALGVARLQVGTAPAMSGPVNSASVHGAVPGRQGTVAVPIAGGSAATVSSAAGPSTATVSSEVSHAP